MLQQLDYGHCRLAFAYPEDSRLKCAEDLDGPEEFHVVLLDNGRSEMLGNEFHEMLRCIRCGACVEVCPTRALELLDLSLDFKNLGTPVLNPDHGGCIAWGEKCLRCVEACPTQALSGPNPLTKRPLGRVRIIEPVCYNCMLCFRKCPVKGAVLFPNPNGDPFKAELEIPTDLMTADSPLKPYIDDSLCTGCGLCVHYCPPKAMTLSPIES